MRERRLRERSSRHPVRTFLVGDPRRPGPALESTGPTAGRIWIAGRRSLRHEMRANESHPIWAHTAIRARSEGWLPPALPWEDMAVSGGDSLQEFLQPRAPTCCQQRFSQVAQL